MRAFRLTLVLLLSVVIAGCISVTGKPDVNIANVLGCDQPGHCIEVTLANVGTAESGEVVVTVNWILDEEVVASDSKNLPGIKPGATYTVQLLTRDDVLVDYYLLHVTYDEFQIIRKP